jgi:hypothetical protein
MSSAIRNPILKVARNPSRSTAAPTLPVQQLITHTPTKGFDTSSIPHQPFGPDQSRLSATLSMGCMAQNPATTSTVTPTSVVDCMPKPPNSHLMDVDYVDTATPLNSESTATPGTPDTIMRTLVNYQVRADMAKAQPVAKPVRKRKRRTCAKCARSECSGSQNSSNCRNPCQDCKKTTCRGRNSSRPTKPCNTPGLWDK